MKARESESLEPGPVKRLEVERMKEHGIDEVRVLPLKIERRLEPWFETWRSRIRRILEPKSLGSMTRCVTRSLENSVTPESGT